MYWDTVDFGVEICGEVELVYCCRFVWSRELWKKSEHVIDFVLLVLYLLVKS